MGTVMEMIDGGVGYFGVIKHTVHRIVLYKYNSTSQCTQHYFHPRSPTIFHFVLDRSNKQYCTTVPIFGAVGLFCGSQGEIAFAGYDSQELHKPDRHHASHL